MEPAIKVFTVVVSASHEFCALDPGCIVRCTPNSGTLEHDELFQVRIENKFHTCIEDWGIDVTYQLNGGASQTVRTDQSGTVDKTRDRVSDTLTIMWSDADSSAGSFEVPKGKVTLTLTKTGRV